MTFEWLVVGAGIHGTYLARELLDTGVEADEILLVDRSGSFLGSFERKARACGMDTLRSTFVQHVGPDPFGLETFAEGRGRNEELHSTPDHPPRPSLELFIDHTEHVIDRFDLEALLVEREVTGIDRENDRFAVETTDGVVSAHNVVLAIGPGDRYRRPSWASNTPKIEHVWDVDDPRWINWRHIERELHSFPPGSQARYERVREARNEGTMPSYLSREVRETSSVGIRRGEIAAANDLGGPVSLFGDAGRIGAADRVFLATGFEPVYERPLVGAIADSLGLERGYRGVPVLDDETMAWRRHDGDPSSLFVTGRLAECTAGPLAGNIHGARRAAERIVGASAARRTARVA